MLKSREAEIFRKTKLKYYTSYAKKHPCNCFERYEKIKKFLAKIQLRKHHIKAINPPAELAEEMLNNGEYKECPKGYIYVEYKGYRSYLHTLIVLKNGIIIPKGFGVHHIDKNKKII